MASIKKTLEDIILENDFLEDAMYNSFLNLTAFAEYIQPFIEKITEKKTTIPSLTMTLSRLAREQQKRTYIRIRPDDVRVKTNISMSCFEKQEKTTTRLHKAHNTIDKKQGSIFSVIEGSREVSVIYSELYEDIMTELHSKNKPKIELHDLATLTIHIRPDQLEEVGFMYFVVKQLNFFGIPIMQVYSTLSEFTILLKKDDVRNAMSVLI